MQQPVVIEQNIEADEQDKAVFEIGRLIVNDAAYIGKDWAVIAIVANFKNGRSNMFGYEFDVNKAWQASLPDDEDDIILDKMLELQSAMEKRTGKKWHRALVHIDRVKQDINITFEYNDPDRWTIAPKNLEESVRALHPDALR